MRRIRNMLSNLFAIQRIISLCSDLYNGSDEERMEIGILSIASN